MENRKIFIAGHRGMAGSAVTELFKERGYANIITRSRQELDLRQQAAVSAFMEQERPDIVILAAAKVGGDIGKRQFPLPIFI